MIMSETDSPYVSPVPYRGKRNEPLYVSEIVKKIQRECDEAAHSCMVIVTVGGGVGWLREEFQALGAPDFDRRGAVSDEYIRIFKTLWTESPASFAGRFYRFEAVHCLPQPVQKPHPPLWFGANAPVALKRSTMVYYSARTIQLSM